MDMKTQWPMIDNIETDARRGLEVMRYHTWPVIKQRSVGEHSAQVMRILLAVWPDAPRDLLIHALTHDMGEMAGDLPWPAKRNDPILRERMEAAEERVYSGMVERWSAPTIENSLNDDHRLAFKMCESIEMWEYALTEQNMGNRYAQVIAHRMLLAASTFMEMLAKTSKTWMTIVHRAKEYVQRRVEQEQ